MSEPTQVQEPWKTTVRSLLQFVIGLAAAFPFIVDASGVQETAAGVAGALAIAAGITRVMALPQVNALLPGWLRAEQKLP